MTAPTSPPPRDRSRKRARTTRVMLAGASAFALAACQQDDRVEAEVFPSVEECRAVAALDGNDFTAEDCTRQFEAAMAEHRESAPRYGSEALCEEEHGGACQVETRADGTSIFLPLIAGYMMGSLMSRGMGAKPLYRTQGGRYATAGGGTVLNGNRGSAQVRPSSFNTSPSTRTAQPLSRTAVQQRGGFGAARTSGGPAARGFGG